jgi:putative membrane protein
MYLYLKALHIIFVVTWFAGLFYIPRLFIYNTEVNEKQDDEKKILHQQFTIMMKRLWFGITWPSAILTLCFGVGVLWNLGWYTEIFTPEYRWLLIKLLFVLFLYAYHFSLHIILKQQVKGIFKYTSQQLRVWNEVATVILIAVTMLVTVKQSISLVWGLVGLIAVIAVLMLAIKLYKKSRERRSQ